MLHDADDMAHLRRRIRAVKSTQQITKAMKMVAASKLRRAQERVVQTHLSLDPKLGVPKVRAALER